MFAGLGEMNTVHHFNCATFRPWPGAHLVSHILVCEYDHGLVLIDCGLGTADLSRPRKRLGATVLPLRPALAATETAVVQMAAAGWLPRDVQAIVATHLDYDHIGGAADFPGVPVYTTNEEIEAAQTRTTVKNQIRYRPDHLRDINGRLQAPTSNKTTVIGLQGYQLDVGGRMFLVPMPGHTSGHAAVAIHEPRRGWMIHAGDAFMHRHAIAHHEPPTFQSKITQGAEMLLATDRGAVRRNHTTLSSIAADGDARVFCSHDAHQFETLRNEARDLHAE